MSKKRSRGLWMVPNIPPSCGLLSNVRFHMKAPVSVLLRDHSQTTLFRNGEDFLK